MGEELSPFPRNLRRDSRIHGKELAGLSPHFPRPFLPIFLPLPLRRLLLRPHWVRVWRHDHAPSVGITPFKEGLGLSSVVLSPWASVETRGGCWGWGADGLRAAQRLRAEALGGHASGPTGAVAWGLSVSISVPLSCIQGGSCRPTDISAGPCSFLPSSLFSGICCQ